MHSTRLKLAAVGLLAGLMGCTTVPVDVPVTPSTALLQECPHPSGSAATNGKLAEWLLAYRQALRACNDQIRSFKESP